jgi:hypothetical protein
VGGTGTACGEAKEDDSPQFRLAEESQDTGLLLSVAEIQGETWVVGGRPGKTAILRQRDGSFERVKNPGTHTAWWICELGDELAIVGESGLVLLKTSGGFEELDVGVEGTFYGCAGKSTADFWLVGGDPQNGPPELVHVRSGRAAAPDLGELVPRLPKVLFKVLLVDETLIVVGELGTILTRDAQDRWRLVNPTPEPLFTVSGKSLRGAWVVGGRGSGLAYRYDGREWVEDSPPLSPGLFGISVVGEHVLAVGHRGAIFERGRFGAKEPDKWQELMSVTSDTLHATWLSADSGAWAVGGNVLEQDSARWKGVVLAR